MEDDETSPAGGVLSATHGRSVLRENVLALSANHSRIG